MDWLEIISVRTSGEMEIKRVLGFCKRILALRKGEKPVRISVYGSANYETDLSVHIHWLFLPERQEKSLFGLELARAMSDFGLVNHTLWKAKEGILTK
jgi:hypothetical protein